MGTRSLTVFTDYDGTEIAVMYRQFDGHPDGHGVDLKNWAEGRVLVNGLSGDNNVWNGMDCLAADCVASFKCHPGGIYLRPAGTRGEAYVYTLSPDPEWNPECFPPGKPGRLCLRIESFGKILYEGRIDSFDPEDLKEDEDE